MADVSPNDIRAFLVPVAFQDTDIDNSQSSYTQSGNNAGDPSPAQASNLVVRATGTQLEDSNFSVVTRRSGHAGAGAAFSFDDETDAIADEYGHDAPVALAGYDIVKAETGTHTYHKNASCLGLSDGSLLVASKSNSTDLILAPAQVVVRKRSSTSSAYSAVTVYTQSDTILSSLTGQEIFTAMCLLPDGSILLAFTEGVLKLDGSTAVSQVQTWRSTDDGASWSLLNKTALNTSFDLGTTGTTYRYAGLSIAAAGGQVVLFLETYYNSASALIYQNRLFQYASIDNGATFDQVTSTNDINDFSFLQVKCAVRQNNFVVAYIADTDKVHYIELPHAYFSIHTARTATAYVQIYNSTVATGSLRAMADGQLAMWVDDDDKIYTIIRDNPASSTDHILLRTDDGLSWSLSGGGTAGTSVIFQLTDTTSTAVMPTNINACSVAGRSVMVCNCATDGTNGDSLHALFYGGYATVTTPYRAGSKRDYEKLTWTDTYIPFDTPANISRFTVAGGGSESITNGVLNQQTGLLISQYRTYQTGYTTTLDEGLIVRVVLDPVTRGSISGSTDGRRVVQLEIGDGSKKYQVRVQISTTQFAIYDINGGAQIGTTQSFTGRVELLLALTEGKINCWYISNTVNTSARTYTVGVSNGTVSNGGGGLTGGSVIWGVDTYSTAGIVETNWHEIEIAAAVNTGFQLEGFTNPADLSLRAYPPAGQYVYVLDGVSISTSDGPAIYGDEYNIQTQFEHGISNIFYAQSPSPRVTWRSTNTNQQTISLKRTDNTSRSRTEDNDVLAVHLSNINFYEFKIQGFDLGSGSFVDLADIDCSISINYNAASSVRSFQSNTAMTTGEYINYNELVGLPVIATDGTTTSALKIVRHSEGALKYSATNKQAVFFVDGALPNSGSVATRVAKIIPKDVTVTINLNGSYDYSEYRLLIPSHTIKDTYYQIGGMYIGALLVPGQQYGRGRTISIDSGTVIQEQPDGTKYARNIRPSRRSFRIAWTDAVDMRQLYGDVSDPDYWTASTTAGAKAVATSKDVPDMMLYLKKYLSDLQPVVYLPRIQRATTSSLDVQIFNRNMHHALCLLDGDIQIDSVLGDEQVDEIFRVATLVLEEVV
jgi:hypothetical protein